MDLLHSLTLGDVLREHRRTIGDRLALGDGDVRLTYRELDDRVNRLVNALAERGVTNGDRILWLGHNSFRIFELLLAAAKLGGIVCPANWRSSGAELAFVVDDLQPAVVVWQQDGGDAALEARAKCTTTSQWIAHDDPGADGYEAVLASGGSADTNLEVDPSSSLLAVYTAAFDGRPNAALLSHTSLITQSLLLASLLGVDHDYRYLNCGAMFHVAPFMTSLPTFLVGGQNHVIPKIDAEEICTVVARERITGAFILPPSAQEIVECNRDGRYDLSSLRATFAKSPEFLAMTSPDESPFGQRLSGFGQTEVFALATFCSIGPTGALGASGRTSPLVQLRIVDDSDREVADGQAGEIVLRGPTVGNGYWNRPELNAQRMRSDWWHTNDLGRREADGSLTWIGPKARMIKSAEENIYPAEVEACIESHPAVKEAAIIGVPDERWTQSVKAIVVLVDGTSATADDIIEHCRANIASYKKPRTVEFVDALPKAGWAKDYDALDEQFGGGNYPSSATVVH